MSLSERMETISSAKWAGSLRDQLTPPVQYGLLLIGAVFIWLILSAINGRVDELRQERETLEREIAVLDTLEPAQIWSDRLVLAQSLDERRQARVWTGETRGIIAANLTQSLAAAHGPFLSAQFRRMQRGSATTLTIADDIDIVDGESLLSFTFSAQVERHLIDDYLAALAAMTPAVQIDTMRANISTVGTRPTPVVLSGHIYVQIDAGQG